MTAAPDRGPIGRTATSGAVDASPTDVPTADVESDPAPAGPTADDVSAVGSAGAPIAPQSLPFGSRGLFVGLAFLMVGNGLNGALIGVRTGTEGFAGLEAGLVMAGFFAGFLVAPSAAVRMIPSVGHVRVFAGLASTASSAVLVHAVVVSPAVWTAMRFLFGFCLSALYIVIESWLAASTAPVNRGRTMSVYMVVSMGGLGIGQALISLADPSSFRLFVLSSVLVSMSLVPITLAATTQAPEVRLPDPYGLRSLAREVPTGLVSSFAAGSGAGLLLGVGAIYAIAAGLSIERTAAFLVAPTVGAVALQFPIGRLSDRVSRRGVIFAVVTVAGNTAILGALWGPTGWGAPLLMLVLGGMVYPLYSLAIAYTHDWVDPDEVVGASATLVRVNGAGAMLAPLVVAPFVTGLDPSAFYWSFVAVMGAAALFLAYRVAFRDPLPLDQQTPFVSYPVRATVNVVRMVTRPVRGPKGV